MKLYLPHREVTLDTSLPYPQRKEAIEKILGESTNLEDRDFDLMTVEDYFRFTWDEPTTKVLMDIIGYYLTKNNTEEEGEDKEVLSNKKQKEIRKGSKRHTTFSGLPNEVQTSMGLKDDKQDDYN